MGGLGGNEGHLNHLYEDYNLTFGELKKILEDLSENKISLYEKVDGQNLSLSYNPKTHQPIAARNKSDIKARGLTVSKISDRYNDKPGVKVAFTSAMKAFDSAVRKLTYYQRFQMFDPAIEGLPFVNAEVMSTKNPNVIKYRGNYLVMHNLRRFPQSGKSHACDESFRDVVNSLDQVEVDVDGDLWTIFGPKKIDLSETMNRHSMSKALSSIDHLMGVWDLNDQNTIRDFLIKSIFTVHASHLTLGINDKMELESRILDERGAKPTPSIVKNLLESQKSAVKELTKNRVTLVREALVPIEMIVNDFGLGLLENSHSYFVEDGEMQVQSLRTRVDNAIESLGRSPDPILKSKINLNWRKLKEDSQTITSTVEGVVFQVNDRAYKVTGAFAPMNQILGWVNPSFASSRRSKQLSTPLPIFVG